METFDAFEFVDFIIEGVNGHGTLEMVVDDPELEAEWFTLDADSGNLSNGDTFWVYLEIPDVDAFVEEKGIIPETFEMSYVLSDFPDAPSRNYFEDVAIGWYGANEHGVLELLQVEGAEVTAKEFTADKTKNLSNGDVVTVSLVESDEYLLETYGYVPTMREMTVTISDLTEALTSVSDIDSATVEDLKSSVSNYFNSYVDDYWSKKESLEKLTYKGLYYSYTEDESVSPQNVCWLIYEVKVKNDDIAAPFTYYWTIGYKNLSFADDGSISVKKKGNYLKITDGKGDGFLDDYVQVGAYKYYGYETLEDLTDAIDKALGSKYHTDDNL